jgi:hypothetical protein
LISDDLAKKFAVVVFEVWVGFYKRQPFFDSIAQVHAFLIQICQHSAAGSCSAFFSVGIHHGGYFVGTKTNRTYVDGGLIWYDEVDSLTWSTLMVENLVEEIGYEMQGRIKVHYVLPILTLSNNGLRRIKDEDDIVFMLKFVDIGHHFFDLYLDHGDSQVAVDWDDVLQYPVRELPLVITPSSF